MHHLKDNDPLGAVLQKLGHFVLEQWLGLMFGHHLQIVPGVLALPLQLHQVVRQLLKVHLGK